MSIAIKYNPNSRFKFSVHRKRVGYGHIETGWLEYLTPQMFMCVIVLTLLIAGNWKVFLEYYHAALVLNSVIFSTFFFAVIFAIRNNINVRYTAVYLEAVDQTAKKDTITDDDVEDMLIRLKTQGRLININDSYGVIRNIQKYGALVFTDQSARLIKSKLGGRISEARKGVSFLGGLMIMLGLIGTYLGLLETVDTVGAVMKKMSSIGGDASGEGMSNFISDLAEPLQGMALAFSASLFGIAGSVFVGIFNNSATHAQNEFIENVSRWIDDRIPRAHVSGGNYQDKNLPGSDDLKSWLSAFVNLTTKSNRKMSQILYVMSKSTQAVLKYNTMLHDLAKGQMVLQESLKATNGSVTALKADHDAVMHGQNRIEKVLAHLHQDMLVNNSEQKRELMNLSQTIAPLAPAMRELTAGQDDIVHKIDAIPDAGSAIMQMQNDMTALALQLNIIMDDLNKQSQDIFHGLVHDTKSDGQVKQS